MQRHGCHDAQVFHCLRGLKDARHGVVIPRGDGIEFVVVAARTAHGKRHETFVTPC